MTDRTTGGRYKGGFYVAPAGGCVSQRDAENINVAEEIGKTMGEVDWRVEETMIDHPLTRADLLMLHDHLVTAAKQIMVAKNHDYSTDSDPFRNFRAFGALSILIRMSDKLARLRSYIENQGEMKVNESVRDTILDTINYAILFYGYLLDEKGRGRG